MTRMIRTSFTFAYAALALVLPCAAIAAPAPGQSTAAAQAPVARPQAGVVPEVDDQVLRTTRRPSNANLGDTATHEVGHVAANRSSASQSGTARPTSSGDQPELQVRNGSNGTQSGQIMQDYYAHSNAASSPQSADQSRTMPPPAKGLTNTTSYDVVARPADAAGAQSATSAGANTFIGGSDDGSSIRRTPPKRVRGKRPRRGF